MATPRKDPKDHLPAGRPSKYDPKYCDEIIAYFDIEPYREITKVNEKTGNEYTTFVANRLPTLARFAASIGVCKQTLCNWADRHPEFMDAVSRAKNMAEDILVTNGLLGLYNAKIVAFTATNYTDMRDQKDHKHEHEHRPHKDATLDEIDAQIRQRMERLGYLPAGASAESGETKH